MRGPTKYYYRHLLLYVSAAFAFFLGGTYSDWLISDNPSPHTPQETMSIDGTLEIDGSSEVSHLSGIDGLDHLILDPVLSIIQSYYFETEAVTNLSLMNRLTAAIKREGLAEVSSSDILTVLGFKDSSIIIDTSSPYTYDRLLHDTVKIAQAIESTGRTAVMDRFSEWPGEGLETVTSLLLSGLDPHSSLLSQQEYLELRQGTEGSFGGLGVIVGIKSGLLTVIRPIPKSPAYRAGIDSFDQITQINGINTFGASLENLVDHMRGPPGTTVQLSLLSEKDDFPRTITLEREIIEVQSVSLESIELPAKKARVARITIENFSSRTHDELVFLLNKQLNRPGNPTLGIILDLRSNPGGLLDQAVQVSNLFLTSGTIVSTVGRRTEVETAEKAGTFAHLPMITLINHESASAAEIVAGALQDHGRSIIVGQPSFGKGSVQTVFELPGSVALKLTIAKYLTPNGVSIQNTGIFPDIWLQPITANPERSRVIGTNRYSNELFLQNRLDGMESHTTLSTHEKYYYLASSSQQLNGQFASTDDDSDYELNLAENVFQKYLDNRSSTQDKGKLTDLARALISKPEHRQRVTKALKDNTGVQWNASSHPITLNHNDLDFSVELMTPHPREGALFAVKYTIRNNTNETIPNVSVFLRSPSLKATGYEQLVGTIMPGSDLTGEVSGKLRAEANNHSAQTFQLGVAVDGEILQSLVRQLRTKISANSNPPLWTQLNILEEIGAEANGIVEPNEQVKVTLSLKNTGKEDLSDVAVRFFNFAGKQVLIPAPVHNIGILKADSQAEIPLYLKSSKRIYQDTIQLGVEISGSEIVKPIQMSYELNSEPNKTITSATSRQ